MEIPQIVFEYLHCFLKHEPAPDEIKQLNETTLNDMYSFSKKHDLAHLLADILHKNSVWPDNSEMKKKFLQERNLAVYRYEQMHYEYQEICDVLNAAGILFLPLKGAVIRAFYPEPWMRTSCDIDILVSQENLQRSDEIIKDKLSYTYHERGDHDISLFAPSGVHLELHYQLGTDSAKPEEAAVLQRIWDTVTREEGSLPYRCSMLDEYFYCYHISHIVKHLKCGGCGVRPILDTWILNHNLAYNAQKREELLQEAGLLKAAKAIEHLAEIWFSGAEADAISGALGEYILLGGVYGSKDNERAVVLSRKTNKFAYLCSRLFMPYKEMACRYPTVKKWPVLYPFFVVGRLFLLFKKGTKDRALNELNQTVAADGDKINNVAKLLKELDLKA